MRYGIPYMGSKNRILKDICELFPKAENFYDLFGGGFSVTHFMLQRRNKDYNNFYFNEPREGIVDLIQDAIAGKYNYNVFRPEFITREMFFKRIDDPYIKMIWSFGNNGRGYLFSKEIEPYKKSMHNAIVFNRFDDLAKQIFGINEFRPGYDINQRRLFLRYRIRFLCKKEIPGFLKRFKEEKDFGDLAKQFQHIQQLERLERLQQLERLERLQRPNQSKLAFTKECYSNVVIKKNSVVYCDPPYKGTEDYGDEFNHDKLFEWAASHNQPVFISEYNINHKDLTPIFKKQKMILLDNSKEKKLVKTEFVYTNKPGLKAVGL